MDILPLKDGPVPCLLAAQALVDKPGIKLATVGVEPDFAAGLEGPQAPASAARNPRLRSCLGSDGPSDPKCIAHIVLVFPSEVHQDSA